MTDWELMLKNKSLLKKKLLDIRPIKLLTSFLFWPHVWRLPSYDFD